MQETHIHTHATERVEKGLYFHSAQLYFIESTLFVADHSIHLQVHTDFRFIGQCNSLYFNSSTPNRPKKYINIGTSKENCTKQMQQSGITKHVDKTS